MARQAMFHHRADVVPAVAVMFIGPVLCYGGPVHVGGGPALPFQ